MTQWQDEINLEKIGTYRGPTAGLTNVSLCVKTLKRAVERPIHLPGFVCFYGPAGWGMSTAAVYLQLNHDAYYVQCQENWTRKAALIAIARELGIYPEKTNYEILEQVCNQLAMSGRPLIVDEFDHLVNKKLVELIRDIYEGSRAAILLIGEEALPHKLRRWERFHSRVLEWTPAQPMDLDDCEKLVNLYCKEVAIAEDLLTAIVRAARGSVRVAAINIETARLIATEVGDTSIDLASWGDRPFHTGQAPEARKYS